MKKLGIIGGVAWPSTTDYYKAICRLSADHHRAKNLAEPLPIPEMSIESLDLSKSIALRGGDVRDDASWAKYDEYFRGALQRLARSGAELAIIASNTPHNRFASITRGVSIPVLNIFDAVASHCQGLGVTEMLILGTAPTMESPIFAETLARYAIKGWSPKNLMDRAEIVKLIRELQAEKNENADRRIQNIVRSSFESTAITPTVCLACTELPLAFAGIDKATELFVDDVRYINTTMVHAQAAFAEIMRASRPDHTT